MMEIYTQNDHSNIV